MADTEYDVIVLGAGPAGENVADRAVKAATKGKTLNGVGKGLHPARKPSARKASGGAARPR